MWSKFLKAFHRKPVAPSAAEIRGQLSDLRHRHERVTADRDALALDAVNSERIALHYLQLDDEASELERGMQLLTAALPSAEAKEAYGKVGHEPLPSTGEAVRARIIAEQKAFAKAVKDAGVKPE